jgi:hypothetical protein
LGIPVTEGVKKERERVNHGRGGGKKRRGFSMKSSISRHLLMTQFEKNTFQVFLLAMKFTHLTTSIDQVFQ